MKRTLNQNQRRAVKRNWHLMKTAGFITELNRMQWFTNSVNIRTKCDNAINAIRELQKEIQDSKTEEWIA